MNILMTTNTVGGVWTYSLDLAAGLAASGVRVHLAAMGKPLRPDQRLAVAGLSNVSLHESTYKLEWMDEPWQDVDAAGKWLLDIADEVRPDLVHVNGFAHAAVPFDAPVLSVAHSCVLSWWNAVHGALPPEERWREYRRRAIEGLRRADLVVAPSAAMLTAVAQHYGPFAEARVIYLARAAGEFRPRPKLAMVFSAGHAPDRSNNIQALEKIASTLAWPVYMAGSVADLNQSSTADPAVGVRCLLAGGGRQLGALTARQTAGWLSFAGIFCHPARYEPLGLSVLEAAMCGCALVLGDIPTLREVWGDAALFVPPDDEAALAAAVQELIHNPARRAVLAQRARMRSQRYDLATMAGNYLAAYQRLIGQRRGKLLPSMGIAGAIGPGHTSSSGQRAVRPAAAAEG
jgi:glycosyltransferase involved in cell wall biosynthesis